MPINKSYLAALGILAAVIVFFTVGSLLQSSTSAASNTTPEETARFEVVVNTVHADLQPATLTLRGRTEARRPVIVRAETGGRVVATPAEEGGRVSQNDVLCRLDLDARGAALAQAEADLRARQLEYDAATELSARGHRSANQVAATEAARDAAQARLQAAQEEIANINVRAPFDGFFDGLHAEIGDFIGRGDPCATIVQLDPILIVAEVAERDVAALQAGMPGSAELLTGETINGVVRFVERSGDPATRTFRVELEAPNPDGLLRSGVTAELNLPLAPEPAHRVPTSILALNSEGTLGIRIVEGETVRFVPIQLLRDDGEQVWVAGLPDPADVIVLGQDFVADGTQVDVAREARP